MLRELKSIVVWARTEYAAACARDEVRRRTMPVYEPGDRPGSFSIRHEQLPEPGYWVSDVMAGGIDRLPIKSDVEVALAGVAPAFQRLKAYPPEALVTSILHGAIKDDILGGQPAVDEVVEALSDFMLHEQRTVRSVLGVRGLRVDEPVGVLDSIVVPATDERRSAVLAPGWGSGHDFEHGLETSDSFVVTTTKVHWTVVHAAKHLDHLQYHRQALRVAVHSDLDIRGPISHSIGIASALFANISIEGRSYANRRYGRWRTGGPPLALSRDHILFLDETKHALGRDALAALRVALDRLERAATRTDSVDRLVDLAVSVEALVTAADQQGDIGYRLRMRIARLMAVAADRVELSKFVRDVYRARSKAIHGSSVSGLEAIVLRFADVVRALVAFTALGVARHRQADLSALSDAALLGDPRATALVDALQQHPIVALPPTPPSAVEP